MCESIMRASNDSKEQEKAEIIFLEHLLEHFVSLQSDKIVNVRIQISLTLSHLYRDHSVFREITPEEIKLGIYGKFVVID